MSPALPTRIALCGMLCAILCASAHALERVNLTTGFSYDCTRQEPADLEHTRLYLYTPGNAETNNFIVIASHQIASVEPLPDPIPPTPAAIIPAATPPVDLNVLLSNAGARHNIDVELLASIVRTESGGHTNAVSHAGARGLMQLMPATAREQGVQDPTKPDQNIAGGSSYLDSLLVRYKDNLALALAAYNAGPGAVDRYHGIPPYRETRAYVYRVMSEFKRRKLVSTRALAMATVAAH